MSRDTPLIVEETKQHSKEEDKRELIEEVKKQLWLSGPLVSVSLLNFGIDLISVMFVGHLGELTLSGASMATSFATVTGFSLLVQFLLEKLILEDRNRRIKKMSLDTPLIVEETKQNSKEEDRETEPGSEMKPATCINI
ncbi:hypothetical protein KIW84_010858 [Lathyrus oleraceus]|uniref:Uncharacterized protein n=1 Tax=Pisum sativum TaxID=3888 RepID=A0A9D4YM10_PEA|nr:hypothetical protein KIW84_010858 [Pisum sativum]